MTVLYRARAWASRRPGQAAGLVLIAMVVVSAGLRFWGAQSFTVPWIAPDEMVYGLLGQDLWEQAFLVQPSTGLTNRHPAGAIELGQLLLGQGGSGAVAQGDDVVFHRSINLLGGGSPRRASGLDLALHLGNRIQIVYKHQGPGRAVPMARQTPST